MLMSNDFFQCIYQHKIVLLLATKQSYWKLFVSWPKINKTLPALFSLAFPFTKMFLHSILETKWQKKLTHLPFLVFSNFDQRWQNFFFKKCIKLLSYFAAKSIFVKCFEAFWCVVFMNQSLECCISYLDTRYKHLLHLFSTS